MAGVERETSPGWETGWIEIWGLTVTAQPAFGAIHIKRIRYSLPTPKAADPSDPCSLK